MENKTGLHKKVLLYIVFPWLILFGILVSSDFVMDNYFPSISNVIRQVWSLLCFLGFTLIFVVGIFRTGILKKGHKLYLFYRFVFLLGLLFVIVSIISIFWYLSTVQ